MLVNFIHYPITDALIEILTFLDRVFPSKINGNKNYNMILYQQRPNGLKQKTFTQDYVVANIKSSPVSLRSPNANGRNMIDDLGVFPFYFERRN